MKTFHYPIHSVKVSEKGIHDIRKEDTEPGVHKTNQIGLGFLSVILVLSWTFLPHLLSFTLSLFALPILVALIIALLQYSNTKTVLLPWNKIVMTTVSGSEISFVVVGKRSKFNIVLTDFGEGDIAEFYGHIPNISVRF